MKRLLADLTHKTFSGSALLVMARLNALMQTYADGYEDMEIIYLANGSYSLVGLPRATSQLELDLRGDR